MAEAVAAGAEPWMLDTLKCNFSYLGWGNHEDYMCGDGGGWSSRLFRATVADLIEQDDLNEIVHGYYFIRREESDCLACRGNGYNAETSHLSETWNQWQYQLGDVEVEALAKSGRLRELVQGHYDDDKGIWYQHKDGTRFEIPAPTLPSADVINRKAAKDFLFHDGINRYVCVRARAQHMGVYGKCDACGGRGSLFGTDPARLSLQLWVLHPRKGCSRGMVIETVNQSDIPTVQAYFRTAIERMHLRLKNLAGL